jgi:hypothetical protein
MATKDKSARKGKVAFSQDDYEFDEDHEMYHSFYAEVLHSILSHGSHTPGPSAAASQAARITKALLDAYDDLSEDFDDDAADLLEGLFVATIHGTILGADVASIKGRDQSAIVEGCVEYTKAAWSAYASSVEAYAGEEGDDEDEDDEEEDEDD